MITDYNSSYPVWHLNSMLRTFAVQRKVGLLLVKICLRSRTMKTNQCRILRLMQCKAILESFTQNVDNHWKSSESKIKSERDTAKGNRRKWESTDPEILRACNTSRIFIWSVTSPNFRRHNVTSFSPMAATLLSRTPSSSKILVKGFHSAGCERSISSFALLAIDLSCWRTVRSQDTFRERCPEQGPLSSRCRHNGNQWTFERNRDVAVALVLTILVRAAVLLRLDTLAIMILRAVKYDESRKCNYDESIA